MKQTIDVLVSTMGQQSDCNDLIKKNNLIGNLIITNQTSVRSSYYANMNGSTVDIESNIQIGVGRSRNNNILRSNAEFCVIADDDMVFKSNYKEIILQEFEKFPTADLIILNLNNNADNDKNFVVNFSNYRKYGAARFIFRRESIINKDILFSLNFGGGSKYSSGEDTIFLRDCLKSGLVVIKSSACIAELSETRESTWFTGFNSKYYFDKGALLYKLGLFSYLSYLFILPIRSLINPKGVEIPFYKIPYFMYLGKKGYINDLSYEDYLGER